MCDPFPPVGPQRLPQIKYLGAPFSSPSTSHDQDILMPSCSRISICSHLPLLLDAFVSLLPHFSMSLSQRLLIASDFPTRVPHASFSQAVSSCCLSTLFSHLQLQDGGKRHSWAVRHWLHKLYQETKWGRCLLVAINGYGSQSFIHFSANKAILLESITCQ